MTTTTSFRKHAVKHIIWLGLVIGTLDALATLLINYKVQPAIICRFIASGLFGQAAYSGGAEMIVAGAVFHYLIAYVFTTAFYLLYPFFNNTFKNRFIIGALYGLIAWLIMNLGVAPASKIGFHAIKIENIIMGMAVLIICVGLPVAIIADTHLRKYSK